MFASKYITLGWILISVFLSKYLNIEDRRKKNDYISPAKGIKPLFKLYLHGSSFAFGGPLFSTSPPRAFASYSGTIVVSPSYKLAPEYALLSLVQSALEVVSSISDLQNFNTDSQGRAG